MSRVDQFEGGDSGGSRVLTVEEPERIGGLTGNQEPERKPAPQSVAENNVDDMGTDTLKTTPESSVEANGVTGAVFDSVNHVEKKAEPKKEESPVKADAVTMEAKGPSEADKKADASQTNVEKTEVGTTEKLKEESVDSSSDRAHDDHVTDKPGAKPESQEEESKEEGEVEEDSGAAPSKEDEASKEDDNSNEKPKFELPYSTRGRHHARDSSEFEGSARGFRDTSSDADIRDIASDLGLARPVEVGKDIVPGTSFLDALSEEERRLRTRYLPEVDGIRSLHKSEIKRDISLARSIMSSTGVAGTLKKPRGRKPAQVRSSDEDRMDIDEEEGNGHSEDERSSDISSRHGGSTSDIEIRDTSIFSGAFVAPPDNVIAPSNGETSDTREGSAVPPSKRWQTSSKSPLVVESISAFNPPRPPESVGPKKKNRMLRWERRPQDVEHDLRATRKTVQKTREELHRAERERERIESFGAVVRTHFLSHLDSMKQESIQLNEELASIQVDCVKAADLLTSRTRSRGVGKGVYVMRDVISVLKTRGASLSEKNALPSLAQNGKSLAGIGGLSSLSFLDWDCSTNIVGNTLAGAWILPGDKVQTPYGEGETLHVFGPTTLNVNDPPVEYARPPPAVPVKEDVHPSAPAAQMINSHKSPLLNSVAGVSNHHGFGSSPEAMILSSTPPKDQFKLQGSVNGSSVLPGQVKSNPIATGITPSDGQSNDSGKKKAGPRRAKEPNPPQRTQASSTMDPSGPILLPRVCVRLPYGVGFFSLDAVTSKEDPSSYSDAMLAARWKKMVEVAKSSGTFIDVAGMEHAFEREESSVRASVDDSDEASAAMRCSDVDRMEVEADSSNFPLNGGEQVEKQVGVDKSENMSADAVPSSETTGDTKAAGDRFVPLGAGMLPTASSRGAMLDNAPISALENGVHSAFHNYSNDLGRPNNPGVPEEVKSWEGQRYETCLLRAKVLQLRNELYRQRRIRTLNERTFINSRDRSHRAENLLTEMKSDLSSLKDRLEEELYDLGIDEDQAGDLMSSYYRDKEISESSTMDATPPPKRKRKLPKEQPRMEPKHTRRRAADAAGDANSYEHGNDVSAGDGVYGDNHDDKLSIRMSGDEMGMEQSSDDDADRRAHKRSRIAA